MSGWVLRAHIDDHSLIVGIYDRCSFFGFCFRHSENSVTVAKVIELGHLPSTALN
jgi:hypothetical protein